MAKHPIQPVITDDHGILRFKENAIVRYLLDNGGIDMNRIACLPFSQEDREQFAQLIGYSLGGAPELPYFRTATLQAVELMREHDKSEDQARIESLESMLSTVRKLIAEVSAAIYDHEEDY